MAAVGPVLLGRCVLGVVATVVWGCALWRVAVGVGGPISASLAAGGWGLSLLPVHAAAATRCNGPTVSRVALDVGRRSVAGFRRVVRRPGVVRRR